MKYLICVLLVSLMASQAQAMNPSSTDHFNTGALPEDRRCNITISSQAIDFGILSRWQLKEAAPGNTVMLGQRNLSLSVSCPYSQVIHLYLHGDLAQDGSVRFGRAGSLKLNLVDAQLDGQPVQLTPLTLDRIRLGAEQNSLILKAGSSFAASRNGSLIIGKAFTAQLEVRPFLPEHEVRVRTHQRSDSRLTIDLIP